MFTDIVGYTALMAESEETGLRVRERHRALVRPLVERYHGEAIEARGDESLSTFPTALDAVNCALAIEAAARDDAELKLHIGIHLGDVVIRGGEVSGDGVNIASRICALSSDGGVRVSGEVYRSVRNQPHVEARALGEQDLKNVPEPIAVYALSGHAEEPSSVSAAAHPEERKTIRSLAVLPLDNLSGNPEQEYVADGVTDALIGSLSQVSSELMVISRTSAKQYKGTTKSARAIAGELGVDFVIEGTAQRHADRVLIRIQLIEARTDSAVLAQSYERDLRDFFGVQREIARAVAAAIRVALEQEPLGAAARPVDPEALDLYLRAVSLWGPVMLVAQWGSAAKELLARSVLCDPDFAEGWVKLANAHVAMGIGGLGLASRDAFQRAREAAQQALDLDDRLGAAHAALGTVRLYYDWDFPGARSSSERALELSPSDPEALSGRAWYLTYTGLGRGPETERLLERLLQVAPLDLFYRTLHMTHFFYTREYERGLAEAKRIRVIDPEFVDVNIGMLYLLLGRPDDFVREHLAWLAQFGAAFGRVREVFQRGNEEGGCRAGRGAAWEKHEYQGGDSGCVWPRVPDCTLVRPARGDGESDDLARTRL